jgi:hypothetical protein
MRNLWRGLTANTPENNPVRKAYEQHVTPNKGVLLGTPSPQLYLAYGLEHKETQYFSAVSIAPLRWMLRRDEHLCAERDGGACVPARRKIAAPPRRSRCRTPI